jgi:hypothetical protein
MATTIKDARVLYSLRVTESKGDKSTVQLSATEDYLIICESKNPSFWSVLADTTPWPNLGGKPLPQLDDKLSVSGKDLYVTSRDLSYYKDNERSLVMSVRYDAKDEDAEEPPKPEGTDPETWQRITVTSQQITKPAIGWPTFGALPAENAGGEGSGAQNSAGDPVDGLEEESSLIKLTYTNTQVLSPAFAELQRYTNRCNATEFLGGAPYTVRMIGWNAEYDQKNNFWSVSVEFLYNPDEWKITYFDAGYNEIVDGERLAILDLRGNPVSKPVPLNGQGQAQAINSSPTGDNKPTEPVELYLFPYKLAEMNQLFDNCAI